MKTLAITVVAFCALGAAIAQKTWHPDSEWFRGPRISQRPKGGYVRSADTAIQIGRAVITDAFGKRFLDGSGQLRAKEFDGVWVVYSEFESHDKDGSPNLGGATTVEISRISGAILSLQVDK